MSATFTQLRAFVAVARARSVHEAARQLFVRQPSVSAAVAALARSLGVALVEREGRGIRLTKAGEAFAPYAAEILGLLEQGQRAAAEAVQPERARLRVVAVNTAGEFLVPPLIQGYRAANPDVEVLLEIGNRRTVMERVETRQADVGIGGRPRGGEIEGRPFAENELVIVGRDPAVDLTRATWLLRETGSGTREATEAFLAERGIEPAEVLTLGSNGAVKQALALGLGVTLISVHAIGRELEEGVLARIPAVGTPLVRPWYALVARGVAPRPAVQRFLDFLYSDAGREALARVA